jgi:hypothetical protein
MSDRTGRAIGMTWLELLAEIDRWREALESDPDTTPADLEAYAADLAQRAYWLQLAGVRRESAEAGR